MFVIAQDFDVPPYSLPNLDKADNSFTEFVDKQEEDALRKVLGNLLYDQFVEGLGEFVEWDAETDFAVNAKVFVGNDVWKSLQTPNLDKPVVEGLYWTLDEADNQWLLLKNGDDYNEGKYKWAGMNKMLVPYIFSEWLAETYSTSTGGGEVKPKGENAVNISPKRRVVTAYNDFSRITGNGCSKINSLYGYLKEHADLYPDFVYGDPGRKNIFNL